jgi:hypothetical protein
MTVFCDAAQCSLVEIYRRFRGAYCLHHCCDGLSSSGRKIFRNIGYVFALTLGFHQKYRKVSPSGGREL